ncbi:MAG: hypothetical protein P9L97_04120 [Candidatus Tenebribacter davisii]|jgi:hypothetical protein|nr:hypothetical protein [Candidatus Tenebribacter davisii]
MKKNILLLITIITISCSMVKKQTELAIPVWYKAQVEGYVISCAEAENPDEYLARLAAKNIAFQTYPTKIQKHLNDYVAENCITPGDETIQAELDKIFNHFTKYLMNVEEPKMEMGESVVIKVKGKGVRCYVQLKMEQPYLHAKFVQFLETSDLYMIPSLRNILKKCFKD